MHTVGTLTWCRLPRRLRGAAGLLECCYGPRSDRLPLARRSLNSPPEDQWAVVFRFGIIYVM